MKTQRRRECDASYFTRRAAEERAAAEAASGNIAEEPHRRLAEHYAQLAASIDEVQDRLD